MGMAQCSIMDCWLLLDGAQTGTTIWIFLTAVEDNFLENGAVLSIVGSAAFSITMSNLGLQLGSS